MFEIVENLKTLDQGQWMTLTFGNHRFLPNMGMAAILVMWAGPFEQNGGSTWNLASIGPVVSE